MESVEVLVRTFNSNHTIHDLSAVPKSLAAGQFGVNSSGSLVLSHAFSQKDKKGS